MKIRIFSEGKSDVKFLKDFVTHLNLSCDELSFRNLGGISGMKNTIQFEESTFEGNKNLVILDADSEFKNRIEVLDKLKANSKIEFELFLFPNHKDEGALEDLLFKLVNQKHISVLDCFDSFEKCLLSSKNKYFIPEKKDKVFAYLDAIEGKKGREKFGPDKRNYRDANLWDLQSEYLENLKVFLEKAFK